MNNDRDVDLQHGQGMTEVSSREVGCGEQQTSFFPAMLSHVDVVGSWKVGQL